ncbi:MAG: CaiB/BaiF CoA-transferase family protein [Acidimicrobiia bacterium]|nr:CaiB/BaiF CoA-transferase family protein [Acidimicrobiia bacterium]
MGPLTGVRVVELAALGPVPFAAMLLGDLGADVVRIDRPGDHDLFGLGRVTCRNRRSVGLDLKEPAAVAVLLEIVATADVLLEGLRPGVTERLGIGPDVCMERNARLVYGRMTGWGQNGPMRDRAGHDINYIALSGALASIGEAGGRPVPPLNLVGDYGGGALYLVMGVLAALIERQSSGHGQVIDAAMVDGSASLMTMFYEFYASGLWPEPRGANLLDGGAPFYDTYETSDGGWMAVGALEPRFFAELLTQLDIHDFDPARQYDRDSWPELRDRLTDAFTSRTREEWSDRFVEVDACVAPVLSIAEAPGQRLNAQRGVFIDVAGVTQPAPAPRFSRTKPTAPSPAPMPGADTEAVLAEIGIDTDRVGALRTSGAIF